MKYGDGQLMSQSVGTIYSMAPEVLCGKTYTNACDAWSVGIIAYMLLSENFAIPFDGNDDVEIAQAILDCHLDFSGAHWSKVSEEAKDFIRSCLAKYPHHRFTIQAVRLLKILCPPLPPSNIISEMVCMVVCVFFTNIRTGVEIRLVNWRQT
jgi:serine/threonine protein kinase